jgi:TrmH family RNA methyltransferase
MGSIARVNVVEAELRHYFNAILDEAPVYGTFMDGEPIYSSALIPNGHIIIGNEGRGIASELQMYITHRISIPGPLIHSEGKMAESLNASIAAALVIAEFRRQHSAI